MTLALSSVIAAQANATGSPCENPTSAPGQAICATATDADTIVTVCSGADSPCARVVALADSVETSLETLIADCTSSSPTAPACATAEQTIGAAENDIIGCLLGLANEPSLFNTGPPDALGCGTDAALAQQVVAFVEIAAQQCASGQNATCAQELDAINELVAQETYTPGALPGTTDPNTFLVNPTALASKMQLLANNESAISVDIATGLTLPPPDESGVPTSPPPNGSGAPSQSKVGVTGYAQGNHPWCLEASTATTLSAFGVTSSLSELYSTMRGTSAGTPTGNAVPVLNNRDGGRNTFSMQAASNSDDVVARAATDVWNFHSPLIAEVDANLLHWWAGQYPPGKDLDHALTVYGYYTTSGGGVFVSDSAFNHTYSSNMGEFWPAMGKHGDMMDW